MRIALRPKAIGSPDSGQRGRPGSTSPTTSRANQLSRCSSKSTLPFSARRYLASGVSSHPLSTPTQLAEFWETGDLSGPKRTCFMVEGSSLLWEAVLSPETPLRHPFPAPPFLCPPFRLATNPFLSKMPQGRM